MSDLHKMKPKVHIEFDIIKNSDNEKLIKELQYLIGLGQFIIVWSKTHLLEEMLHYCKENELTAYIWDYLKKDACYYSSVEFIIDNDQKVVDMFTRAGIRATFIERII